MMMYTGQIGILSSRQARFQIVDVFETMKPLTELSREIVLPQLIPTFAGEALRVAQEEQPGPVRLRAPVDLNVAQGQAGIDTTSVENVRNVTRAQHVVLAIACLTMRT